jgi:glycerol transport system ATP-binding protein
VEALTFAEQVMVMLEGEILQIGTPQDLFENPEHTFVGYFIGSPGMNFLPCTIEGNLARIDGADIPLDEETATLGGKASGKLELGIRPMYLEVNHHPVENGVPAQMVLVEDQGSHKIATLKLAGKTMQAMLPEGKSVPEGRVWIVFPRGKVRLYTDGRLVKSGPIGGVAL